MAGRFARQAQKLVRSPVVAGLILVAIAAQVLLAYRAVAEWRNSTALLVDQRAEEVLTLLVVAINRDMKGVHTSVLAPLNERDLDLERPYDLADKFARAFAQALEGDHVRERGEQPVTRRAVVDERSRQPSCVGFGDPQHVGARPAGSNAASPARSMRGSVPATST